MTDDELILKILRNTNSFTSQKSLASELGHSVGKINYVLKALTHKGLIKIESFAKNPNKRNYQYLLTEKGIKAKIELTERFIERKKKEYEELKNELEMMRGEGSL